MDTVADTVECDEAVLTEATAAIQLDGSGPHLGCARPVLEKARGEGLSPAE